MRCLSTLNRPCAKRNITHSELARRHNDRLWAQYSAVYVGRVLTPRLVGLYWAPVELDSDENVFTENERSAELTRLGIFFRKTESKCAGYSKLADGCDNSRHGRYWAETPNTATGERRRAEFPHPIVWSMSEAHRIRISIQPVSVALTQGGGSGLMGTMRHR